MFSIPSREILAAMPDAFLLKAGQEVKHPHPFAEQVACMTLKQMAMAAGALAFKDSGYPLPSNDNAIMGRGLGTKDFGTALAGGLRHLAATRYDAFADHLPLCARLEVNDFRDIEFPEIGTDVALKEVNEAAAYTASSVVNAGGSTTARLRTYGRIMAISRKVIINDDIGLLDDIFASFGSGAARIENQQIFSALAENPNLPDGEPLFSTELGNYVRTSLAIHSVGVAIGMLRKQPLRRGEPANNKARYLVVSAEEEGNALAICESLGGKLEVIASPNIAEGAWYVFADPEKAPVIHRLVLRNSDPRPVRIDQAKSGFKDDTSRYKVRADIGVAITSRIGVIKMEAN